MEAEEIKLYCLISYREGLLVCKLWDKQLLIHIVRKSIPRFTKSPSLVLIGVVWTEIQAFKNVKNLQEMYGNPDKSGYICKDLCKFFAFLNACISVQTSPINTKLGDLWISLCSFWLCGSIVANPIIYRLVPSPSRYEVRQCSNFSGVVWTRNIQWNIV